MLHRSRQLLVRQRTMLSNAIRGHMAELGIISAKGRNGTAGRMLLPGTLGDSRSKIFVTFDAGAFVSCAATFVDSSEAAASNSKAIFFTVTLLLMRGFSIRRACPIGKACRSSNQFARPRMTNQRQAHVTLFVVR